MRDRRSDAPRDPTDGTARRPVAAVLAVKDLSDAKSRLGSVLSASARRELVLAMMSDTVTAARSAGVDDVVVVTPDPAVVEAAAIVGARAVADAPHDGPADATHDDAADATHDGAADAGAADGTGGTGSLNRAFGRGIVAVLDRDPGARIVVLQADLPALRAEHLRAAIAAAEPYARAVVPDRTGTGTAMLVLDDPRGAITRFGVGSAAAHRDDGAHDLVEDGGAWPDLRTDVDTITDLEVALALGVGPSTTRVLRDVSLSSLA